MTLIALLNDLVDLADEAQEYADANPDDTEAAPRAKTLADVGLAPADLTEGVAS